MGLPRPALGLSPKARTFWREKAPIASANRLAMFMICSNKIPNLSRLPLQPMAAKKYEGRKIDLLKDLFVV